jgi:hypothetical protein
LPAHFAADSSPGRSTPVYADCAAADETLPHTRDTCAYADASCPKARSPKLKKGKKIQAKKRFLLEWSGRKSSKKIHFHTARFRPLSDRR